MSIQKINPRFAVLILFMVAAAGLRLASTFNTKLSPLDVLTPIGAMALFGGAYFGGNWKPYAFPLLTLFISDLVLSFTIHSDYRSGLLYQGWIWTYGAFALMAVAGKLIIRTVNIKNFLAGAIVVTLIHWLVSDIGGCLLQKDSAGMLTVYLQRLVSAIPYEWKFLLGTLIFGGIMFGAFEWMGRRFPQLRLA
jgi:hypothetical protein